MEVPPLPNVSGSPQTVSVPLSANGKPTKTGVDKGLGKITLQNVPEYHDRGSSSTPLLSLSKDEITIQYQQLELRLQSFRDSWNKENIRRHLVESENKELKVQLESVKVTRDIEKRERQLAESERKELERKLSKANRAWNIDQEARKLAESDIENLQNKLEESELRATALEAKCEKHYRLYNSAMDRLRLSKPLLEVGVVVRRKFLEKAAQNSATWMDQGEYTADSDIVDAGRAAAHLPNAPADLVLYQCGFLSLDSESGKFEHIYITAVKRILGQFLHDSQSQMELLNLRAVLFSSVTSNDVNKFDTMPYLEAILRLENEVYGLRPDTSYFRQALFHEGEPAEDPLVWEKLAQLKEINRRILSMIGKRAGA